MVSFKAYIGRCRRALRPSLRLAFPLVLGLLCAAPVVIAQENPDTAPPVRLLFTVFGDCRPETGIPVSSHFPRIVQNMAAEDPDFVLGLGDYVAGVPDLNVLNQQFTAFFQALLPLQQAHPTPMAFAPGNHDIIGSTAALRLYTQRFKRAYYSFDQEDCHFIILNSCEPGHEHAIEGAQWEWLNADLAANKDAQFIFVAVHDPLFPVAEHRGSSLDRYPPKRDALHSLFVQYRVSCVFAGHEHVYHHERRDSVDYFISGGAGAPLGGSRTAAGFYHYLSVEVTDDQYAVHVKSVSAE